MMRRSATALLCAMLCGGCLTSKVSTRMTETVLNDEGRPVVMEYEAKSKAGPLGELDLSVHTMDYVWSNTDEGENRIKIGQESEGISNAGQAAILDMMTAMGASIGSIVSSIISDLIDSGIFVTSLPADP